MLIGKNLITKTHYDILGVRENASYDEIRASYRSLILDTHPDKLQNAVESSSMVRDLENRFVEVQKAWEILSDSKLRFAYDCELQLVRNDFVASEDVYLEDLTVEIVDEILGLFHLCRCGDYYSINSSELEEMGYKLTSDGNKVSACRSDDLPSSVLLPCGSCSLHVRLLINYETKV